MRAGRGFAGAPPPSGSHDVQPIGGAVGSSEPGRGDAGDGATSRFLYRFTFATVGAVSNRTYALSEIVGTSTEGVSEAIRNGVSRADETLRHIDWFEVTDVRGHVVDGEVAHYQVTMKVGYRLEER